MDFVQSFSNDIHLKKTSDNFIVIDSASVDSMSKTGQISICIYEKNNHLKPYPYCSEIYKKLKYAGM